jgi:hypothetical protein
MFCPANKNPSSLAVLLLQKICNQSDNKINHPSISKGTGVGPFFQQTVS